jgi:hypothetical protein
MRASLYFGSLFLQTLSVLNMFPLVIVMMIIQNSDQKVNNQSCDFRSGILSNKEYYEKAS